MAVNPFTKAGFPACRRLYPRAKFHSGVEILRAHPRLTEEAIRAAFAFAAEAVKAEVVYDSYAADRQLLFCSVFQPSLSFSSKPFAEQCSTLPPWAGVAAAVTWRPLLEALLPILIRSFMPPVYGPDENRSFGVENLVEDADVPET